MRKRRFVQIAIICCLISIFPALAGGLLDEGIEYLENQEFQKAKTFFSEKVKQDEQDDAAQYYLGRSYLLSGDHDKAINHLKKAVKINGINADYHYSLGAAWGTKAQKSSMMKAAILAPKIIREFEKCVELDSTHIQGNAAAANFYILAPPIMGGDIKKARKAATRISRLDEIQASLIWATIYEKQNQPDLAEKAYEKYNLSFNDTTGDVTFYNRYGYFLLKQDKVNQAVAMFEKQVTLAPDAANPHDSLGDGYRVAGRLEDALAAYEKALALDPDSEISGKKIKELKKQLRTHQN